MSRKIPFLEMFAALHRWAELAQAVEGWLIVSATIDKAGRSARLAVEGASGAGANLVTQVEEAVCRAYGLRSVRVECADPPGAEPAREPEGQEEAVVREVAPPQELDPFARTEAIRQAARKRSAKQPASMGKSDRGPKGKNIFGKPITKEPVPIQDLELDMGTVVIEGDVFAVDNRELKKRGAWVVAFDVTDYTNSIRISKFFTGDEGKALVDGIKKGMHLKVQGRLNMDRFYGDMVMEPVAVMATEKPMKMDNAPEKRVELHLHTTMSATGWPRPFRTPGTPPKRSNSSMGWRPTISMMWTTGWWSTERRTPPSRTRSSVLTSRPPV